MLPSEVRINPDVFDLTRFELDAFSIEWLQTLKKRGKISPDQSKIVFFVIPKEYCSVFRFIDKNEVAAAVVRNRICPSGMPSMCARSRRISAAGMNFLTLDPSRGPSLRSNSVRALLHPASAENSCSWPIVWRPQFALCSEWLLPKLAVHSRSVSSCDFRRSLEPQ